jgi:lipopolysaccharide transport system permease protein
VDLLVALTQADLRGRYGRGPWRLVKWLLDPFALVGVYLVLVTVVLDREGPAPGLSLACAVVPFQLLMMTIVNSMNAVTFRRPILANMAFPRVLLPVASTITESIAFAASMLLLVLMMVVYGVAPTAAIAWLPVVIAINVAFAAALAYPASLLGVWVRDLGPFIISFVRTLFFLAPGLIALEQITGEANELVRLNPLGGIFEAYRSVLLYGETPALWELLYPLGTALVVAAIFVPIYRREQRHFTKVID